MHQRHKHIQSTKAKENILLDSSKSSWSKSSSSSSDSSSASSSPSPTAVVTETCAPTCVSSAECKTSNPRRPLAQVSTQVHQRRRSANCVTVTTDKPLRPLTCSRISETNVAAPTSVFTTVTTRRQWKSSTRLSGAPSTSTLMSTSTNISSSPPYRPHSTKSSSDRVFTSRTGGGNFKLVARNVSSSSPAPLTVTCDLPVANSRTRGATAVRHVTDSSAVVALTSTSSQSTSSSTLPSSVITCARPTPASTNSILRQGKLYARRQYHAAPKASRPNSSIAFGSHRLVGFNHSYNHLKSRTSIATISPSISSSSRQVAIERSNLTVSHIKLSTSLAQLINIETNNINTNNRRQLDSSSVSGKIASRVRDLSSSRSSLSVIPTSAVKRVKATCSPSPSVSILTNRGNPSSITASRRNHRTYVRPTSRYSTNIQQQKNTSLPVRLIKASTGSSNSSSGEKAAAATNDAELVLQRNDRAHREINANALAIDVANGKHMVAAAATSSASINVLSNAVAENNINIDIDATDNVGIQIVSTASVLSANTSQFVPLLNTCSTHEHKQSGVDNTIVNTETIGASNLLIANRDYPEEKVSSGFADKMRDQQTTIGAREKAKTMTTVDTIGHQEDEAQVMEKENIHDFIRLKFRPSNPKISEHNAMKLISPTVVDCTKEISILSEPISDYYDLDTRPFARGKFAHVKRCINKVTKECFAAKCIKKRRRLVDIRHEILLEIEALRLSDYTDRIITLYEVYETPTEIILVLEMANGGELQRVIDDEEFLDEDVVKKMIRHILEGLILLHNNDIAHLDIKPQNLLLTKPYPDGDVKLCDFGMSRRITKDCEIREICGTPDYVAPEILRYDPISLATDMWSMGIVTYVLLTGYSPFGSDNKQQTFCNITQAKLDFPSEIFDKISKEAIDFISKLIVREPSERLTSRQARQHPWLMQ